MTSKNNNARKRYSSFQEFYPFYLSQHTKPHTKLLHFVGTNGAISILGYFLYQTLTGTGGNGYTNSSFTTMTRGGRGAPPDYRLLPLALTCGYVWAWLSHAWIERNKPATFTYPFWSFWGDLRMCFEIWRGQHKIV